MLTTGNFRDSHAVVRQILRRLVLETSVDHQNKLIQDPPRDVQPVQLSSAQCSSDIAILSIRLSICLLRSGILWKLYYS